MLAVAASSEQLTRAMRSLEAAFLIGVEGATEVWLVRHADVYDQLSDPNDPPLSAIGREQAARLAERARRARPAAVYSSPYRRALETARAITSDVKVDPRLVEVALEVDEAGTFDFKEEPPAVVSRMSLALDDIVSAHPGERVVVVSHAAAIMACVTDALHLEPGQLRMLPYYTSVSVLRVLGGYRVVGSIADVAHLGAPPALRATSP
jgi:probable phosphoglycerate mutase